MEEEQEQKRNGKRTGKENSHQGAKIHIVRKLALVPILALDFGVCANFDIGFLALDFGVGANFGIGFWQHWCQFWHIANFMYEIHSLLPC